MIMIVIVSSLLALCYRRSHVDHYPSVKEGLTSLPSRVNAVVVARRPFVSGPFVSGLLSTCTPMYDILNASAMRRHVTAIIYGSIVEPVDSAVLLAAERTDFDDNPFWGWHAHWCCIVYLDVPDLAEAAQQVWYPSLNRKIAIHILVKHPRRFVYYYATSNDLFDGSGHTSVTLTHPVAVDTTSQLWAVSTANNGVTACWVRKDGREVVRHSGSSSPRLVTWAQLSKDSRKLQAPATVDFQKSDPADMQFVGTPDNKWVFGMVYLIGPDFGFYFKPL